MEQNIDSKAMFSFSYGLFVLTARDGGRDNGCIINTALQVTDNPKRVMIGVNKAGYTHELIAKSGEFNLNILSEETPFKVFEHFGFQSGRTVDKFAGCESENRTENGLLYLPKYANAVISGRVVSTVDCGSHTLFVAEVTEAKKLSSVRSATYEYYFANIKPKPAAAPAKQGFICKICGYVYEGSELPADFICPICKHGAADFEPLAARGESTAEKHRCLLCGYIYDDAVEKVKFSDLPADWTCPLCGASKENFELVK